VRGVEAVREEICAVDPWRGARNTRVTEEARSRRDIVVLLPSVLLPSVLLQSVLLQSALSQRKLLPTHFERSALATATFEELHASARHLRLEYETKFCRRCARRFGERAKKKGWCTAALRGELQASQHRHARGHAWREPSEHEGCPT